MITTIITKDPFKQQVALHFQNYLQEVEAGQRASFPEIDDDICAYLARERTDTTTIFTVANDNAFADDDTAHAILT